MTHVIVISRHGNGHDHGHGDGRDGRDRCFIMSCHCYIMISCNGNGHGLSVTLSIFSFLCPFHPLCPFFFFPLCLFYPFGNQYIAILWHWILENEILMTSLLSQKVGMMMH